MKLGKEFKIRREKKKRQQLFFRYYIDTPCQTGLVYNPSGTFSMPMMVPVTEPKCEMRSL